jgi:hypothetical protein
MRWSLGDVTPSGSGWTIYRRHCVYRMELNMPHYEIQGREISNPTRYGEGSMLRAQERLHLHASRRPCGCIAECSGGRRGRSLNPLNQENGTSNFHLKQARSKPTNGHPRESASLAC